MLHFVIGRESLKAQPSAKKRKVGSTSSKLGIGEDIASVETPTSTAVYAGSHTRKGAASPLSQPIGHSPHAGFQRPELERATSTTSHDLNAHATPTSTKMKQNCLSTDPTDWTVDDVMHYLISVDSGLSIHSQLFQKHVSHFLRYLRLFISYFLCVDNLFSGD